MSRAGVVSASYVWMSFCIGVCAMIPSYNIRTRCNATIDMTTERFHLGQIVFEMPWFSTTIETGQTCTIAIVPWYSKPNIQFYFSKLSLDPCYHRLEIQKSTNRNVFTYPRDSYGSKCRPGVSKPLLNEVYTVTGRYLRIKFTWSKHTTFKTSFRLIFNSYGTGSCYNTNEHLCDNHRCIMKNITCKKYNTCGDQSDCSRPTVYNWKETGKGKRKSTIVLTVVSVILLFCVSCCIVSRFRKNSRLGMCMGRVCDRICDFKSRVVNAGRACMSGIGHSVSTCMSSIRRLPRSCRNYFREKCSTCEFRRRPEEETSTPQRPLPPPPQPEQSEPVNRTQIYMSSISNTNEYEDLGEDPPPPYTDIGELPPHYEEVVRQPSKYMNN